ncbi:MAG: chemotaxis protein CheW [Bacteroidetes bacterium]|nr:chemotaxis protein CheW [Bacteroidota bacterium]
MNDTSQFVVFTLDGLAYALRLSVVERIVHVVEVTPLPKAPEVVLGVINVGRRIIPVIDIRKRFRLPEREVNLSDQLVIANTSKRNVALIVDSVTGVIERSVAEVTAAEQVIPNVKYVEGVAKLEDGMVLIHDLDEFLSLDEEKALDDAMGKS